MAIAAGVYLLHTNFPQSDSEVTQKNLIVFFCFKAYPLYKFPKIHPNCHL